LMGRFLLVGKEKAVEVFEILGEKNGTEPDPEWQTIYSEGLTFFSQRKFDEAKNCFQKTIDIRPEGDGPSEFILKQIEDLSNGKDLPKNWSGEIILTGK